MPQPAAPAAPAATPSDAPTVVLDDRDAAPRRPWHAALARLAGSVKLRLALMGVLLVAASVATTVALVLQESRSRTEQVVMLTELEQARRLARVLSSGFVDMQLLLRRSADELAAAPPAGHAALAAHLAARPALSGSFDTVFIADPQGRVLAWRDEHGLQRLPEQLGALPWFETTVRQQRPLISSVLRSRAGGEPLIVLTMPVLQRERGGVAMVLGAALRLKGERLLGNFSNFEAEDPATGVTVVMDGDGKVVSHPDPTRLMSAADADPRLRAALARWIDKGRPVDPLGTEVRLPGHIAAFAGVPVADWVVLRQLDEHEVLAGFRSGRDRALRVGALVALVGGAVLFALTLWLLRPLRQLEQRAARLLERGLADGEGWPDAPGELGRLSRVFRRVMGERAAADARNRELYARMQAVLNAVPVGIAFTQDGRFVMLSRHFSRLVGREHDELQRASPRSLFVRQADHDSLQQRLHAAQAHGGPLDAELELLRGDGSSFWAQVRGAPVHDGDLAAGTIWLVDDVTERRAQREVLSWSSTRDPLTELVNRREFDARLARLLLPAPDVAAPAAPACLLFLDLDGFKPLNDAHGHAAGDVMLKDVARLLGQCAGPDDTVARFGGDEFAVLLPGRDAAAAQAVAQRMLQAVSAHRLPWDDTLLSVGVSIGLVALHPSLPDSAAVMRAADVACYAAKRQGRGRVHTHVPPTTAAQAPA